MSSDSSSDIKKKVVRETPLPILKTKGDLQKMKSFVLDKEGRTYYKIQKPAKYLEKQIIKYESSSDEKDHKIVTWHFSLTTPGAKKPLDGSKARLITRSEVLDAETKDVVEAEESVEVQFLETSAEKKMGEKYAYAANGKTGWVILSIKNEVFEKLQTRYENLKSSISKIAAKKLAAKKNLSRTKSLKPAKDESPVEDKPVAKSQTQTQSLASDEKKSDEVVKSDPAPQPSTPTPSTTSSVQTSSPASEGEKSEGVVKMDEKSD